MNKVRVKKFVLSFSLMIFSIAAYVAIGFFFDVFLQAIPLLIAPVAIIPVVILDKKPAKTRTVAALCITSVLLSVGALSAVGVMAQPVKGEDICCGTTEKFSYTKEFMRDNYDINQRVLIKVWLPQGYNTADSYPVVYVLDGDNLFDAAAGKASQMCAQGKGDCVVVGIGYGYANAYFARGGVVWQDTEHLRGRWRDYCFADDTQSDMPGKILGGESKRGAEYTSFISNTLVPDIRSKYAVSNTNSTLFGHSLGGGLAAYFSACYDPGKGESNPFNNFVIADNAFLDYYYGKLDDFEKVMENAGGKTHCDVTVCRIWGGAVNPECDLQQVAAAKRLKDLGYEGLTSIYWQPEGANHADTQLLGIEAAIDLALGNIAEYTQIG